MAPYYSVLMYNTLQQEFVSSPYKSYFSSMLGKFSCIVSTLLYMLLNKNIRNKLNLMLFYKIPYFTISNQKELLKMYFLKDSLKKITIIA